MPKVTKEWIQSFQSRFMEENLAKSEGMKPATAIALLAITQVSSEINSVGYMDAQSAIIGMVFDASTKGAIAKTGEIDLDKVAHMIKVYSILIEGLKKFENPDDPITQAMLFSIERFKDLSEGIMEEFGKLPA